MTFLTAVTGFGGHAIALGIAGVGSAIGTGIAALGAMGRITSYNVCYTKLLRTKKSKGQSRVRT